MRGKARSGLLALAVAAVAAPAPAPAQVPPTATKPAAPGAGAAPAAVVPNPAVANQTAATVNGDPITRGQVVDLISRYQLPAGATPEEVYRDAVDTLINERLISQFLNRQKFTASNERIDTEIGALEKRYKQAGSDLATELLQSGKSMADLRKELGDRIRWVNYLDQKATDAELKKFVAAHRDLFNGTQVRASHILLKIDPKATPEEKEKVRKKLLDIKRDIESNKISFAEAANKYSEDPGNQEGAGGDLGYFTLNSGFIEEFANPAFALKKGSISDPVETPYGYHLIQVTDRKEGTPFDFERDKLLARQLYAADLQKALLSAERKQAKIDIKPMPPDLFPPAPAPAATGTGTGNAPATKGAAAPK